MITYSTGTMPNVVVVKLDGKVAGIIRHTEQGFRYEIKGGKFHGELFPTLEECKKSLDGSL